MGKNDWYRRTTWTLQDQEEFFSRLNKSRSDFARAQYLRIQALSLQREANPPMFGHALQLLEILFAEYPHPAEIGPARLQQAQCKEALGHHSQALAAYRQAVEADRSDSGVKTNAAIEFALFAVRHQRKDLYPEVLNSLGLIGAPLLFPLSQYRVSLALAIIAWERGQREKAKDFARKALAAADKQHSGLRYHPDVGLVNEIEPDLHARLLEISGSSIE